VKEGGRIDYSIGADVCCCGEPMEGHSSPINCGHTPVSQLDDFIRSLQDERNELRDAAEKLADALNNITICSSRDCASYEAAQALADYRAKFPKGEK
jgi:hypothetical protein